jgi:hypothetical protein
MKECTEEEKALALMYIINKFDQEMPKEDPEGTAILMEVYIDGMNKSDGKD